MLGYLAGDGHVTVSKNDIEIGTASINLSIGLMYCFARLGILARRSEKYSKKYDCITYSVFVTGKQELKKVATLFQQAGVFEYPKTTYLYEKALKPYSKSYDSIHVTKSLLRNIHTNAVLPVTKKGDKMRNRFRSMIHQGASLTHNTLDFFLQKWIATGQFLKYRKLFLKFNELYFTKFIVVPVEDIEIVEVESTFYQIEVDKEVVALVAGKSPVFL